MGEREGRRRVGFSKFLVSFEEGERRRRWLQEVEVVGGRVVGGGG